MKQVVVVKLVPAPKQAASLLRTMEAFNAACNWIASVAFRERIANKFKLQKLVYYDVRGRFGLLSHMAIRAIAKVCGAYRRNKGIRPSFRPFGAMTLTNHMYRLKRREVLVSVSSLDGRLLIPIRFAPKQAAMLDRRRGQAELLYRNRAFYLSISVDVPEPSPYEPSGFIGVDMGIVNLAVTSEGTIFSGRAVNNLRARCAKLRTKLQSKGTKSAKRLLRKRRRREHRFQSDTNHCISKALVTQAKDTSRGIALEDLKGMRERTTVRRAQRRVIHRWAFAQLRGFIEYKARLAGVPVVIVDYRNTSIVCSECGCTDKANRRSQSLFSCTSCGYRCHADVNAARVIAARVGQPVMLPNVPSPPQDVAGTGTSPRLLGENT